MKFFYLSSSPNAQGAFEIHEKECEEIPSIYDRDYLGPFNTCLEAVRRASDFKQNVDVCPHCCDTSRHEVLAKFSSNT